VAVGAHDQHVELRLFDQLGQGCFRLAGQAGGLGLSAAFSMALASGSPSVTWGEAPPTVTTCTANPWNGGLRAM
jgi:hypothetical protein